jgi:hypothetical protein
MKLTIQIFLVGFSLVIVGCSHTLAPNVTVKPTSQYKLCQEQEGLKVAVDPYFEKERVNDSFQFDLLSYGVLPVLIVIENHHPKSGFLLNKKDFLVAKEDEYQANAKESVDPAVSRFSDPTAARVRAVGILLGSFVLTSYALKRDIDVNKMNENMIKKVLIDRTIYPGETYSGFVYFNVGDERTIKEIRVILIRAKNISTDKEFDLIFQIK